jgi:probable HAF family extracellular repeat protein
MDINRTSGKRVSSSQRDFVTAQSNQVTIRKPWKSLPAVALGLLLSVTGWTQAQYRFSKIDVPGATRTEAVGNSTHEIVGDFDDATGTHGFVLNKGAFATIDAPGGVNGTIINGINARGQLAGSYIDAGGMFHGFFDNKGYFTTLYPPGSIRTVCGFINAQGQVVGTYRDANTTRHGFIWRNGTFTIFNVPGDDPVLGTLAFGINDIGEVVGDYVNKNDQHRYGFLRSRKGDFTTFDVPNSAFTIGEGINNAGTIVGYYADQVNGLEHGFVLKNGVFTTVDVPDLSGNAQQTQIQSINAKGEIVGLYYDPNDVDLVHSHGFLGVPIREDEREGG